MRNITSIFISLSIAMTLVGLCNNLAIAEDTETIISGDTISSTPFEPDNNK